MNRNIYGVKNTFIKNSSKSEKELNTDLKLTEKELTELSEVSDALADIIVDGYFDNNLSRSYV